MKLASLKDGSRDGQLIVVSRDLSLAHVANGAASRLQQLLDDWNFLSPQLEDLYATLNGGKARHAFAFDPRQCMAPLPRAFQRVDGAAFATHLERLAQAGHGDLPAATGGEPTLVQRCSDGFLGATDDAVFADEAQDIDVEAGLAVVTGDVAPGTPPQAALEGVRLLMGVADWRLRQPPAAGRSGGWDALQSRPATAFSPLAVTPDELGGAWAGGRVHAALESWRNGRRVGQCDAGRDMGLHFGQLIAALAKTRRLAAGCIVGSGPVSNADPQQGAACIAEQRAIETQGGVAAKTPYLRFGDSVRIELAGADGASVFGAIEQTVRAAE